MKEKDATLPPFKMFSGQITGTKERNRRDTYTFFFLTKTLRKGNNIYTSPLTNTGTGKKSLYSYFQT